MKLWSVLVALFALALVTGLYAADKEVTLKGNIVCGKCTLKETDECSNVLQVKEGDKMVNYYIDDDGKKEKYHACKPDSMKAATVTGVVTEKDGKKHIKASKVELTK
jgi:hypothetical protein